MTDLGPIEETVKKASLMGGAKSAKSQENGPFTEGRTGTSARRGDIGVNRGKCVWLEHCKARGEHCCGDKREAADGVCTPCK